MGKVEILIIRYLCEMGCHHDKSPRMRMKYIKEFALVSGA
jgi:hypothetical protein